MRALRLLAVPWRAVAIDRIGCEPLPKGTRFDLGIVPGATVYADGSPSGALRRRIAFAAELYDLEVFPQLLISGRGSGGRGEAVVGAELAYALGVPGSAIRQEREAMSTAQNASFSADLVQAQKVLVITDTTHVARCERLFRRHFRSVRAVGVPLARQSRVRMAFREAFIEAWSP